MSELPSTPETAATADAEWAQFVQALGTQLAALWPAMPGKLGERYAAFVEHAVQQAGALGLSRAAAVARYVNLWFVWGSGFQAKPGFEWAAAVLAAAPAREWNSVHQLVQRSLQELALLTDARISAAALAAADTQLLNAFAALGVRGALHPAEAAPAPQAACDLQAAELRVLALAVTQAYELQAGEWQRVALPVPAPLRVHAAQALPALVALLSHAPADAPAHLALAPSVPLNPLTPSAPLTRLQARLSTAAVCDADVHPELRLMGSHGLWRWRGHEARSCIWPLATLAQAGPTAGPGTAVGEETSPDVLQLHIQCCGLRDEGEPLGALRTQLWVWPAAQWWLQLQRQAAPMQPLPLARAPAQAPPAPQVLQPQMRCKLEQDGVACDTGPLTQGFKDGLDAAAARALQALQAAWQQLPGLVAAPGSGVLALLVGRAALTWGWRLGPGGMDGRALMRLVADLQLQAVLSDWQLEGELTLGAARARITLRCTGQAPLAGTVRRETAEPPLLALLPQLQTRFRLPLQVDLTPLASDCAAMLQAAGTGAGKSANACTGALVGEAGLRPRSRGGSGLEWFAALRLEAVQLPLQVTDPVLGQHRQTLLLLPAMPLLDWSLG